MLHLLGPREVADVNQTVNTFFKFYEDTEVSEVAHLCGVARAKRIFLLDGLPWVFLQLLDAKRHLALGAVESEDDSLHGVAFVHELLGRAQVLAPTHL